MVFAALGVFSLLLLYTFIDGAWRAGAAVPALTENAALVKALSLTDLCLFTEARYTRHLSQADLHSPFQDHPMGLEHFPSGSLVSPPRIPLHHERMAAEATLSD